jgi:hypothetical protein
MSKKFVACAALAALLLLFQPVALAQKAIWEEYDKLIQSKGAVGAMGANLFGDQVSYYTGALSFSATDVTVPGNNSLPVAIGRSLTVGNRKGYPTNDLPFADWDMDLPNISGVFASGGWQSGTYDQPNNRCSAGPSPPAVKSGTNWFYPKEYWQGHQLSLPGRGKEELIVRDGTAGATPAMGGPYPWVTASWTYLSCLPSIKNGWGEGFLAVTADGTKYWFDWMASFGEPILRKQAGIGTGDDLLVRRRVALYATRVEDRFGNWLTYTYTNTSAGPIVLSRIESSDGRLITVDRYTAQGFVSSISSGGHTWTYDYDTTDASRPSLRSVILPDSSRWTIVFPFSDTVMNYYKGPPDENWRDCSNPGDVVETSYTGTITHPSGAVGEFTVFPTRFQRTGVPFICYSGSSNGYNTNDDVSEYPIMWDAYALTKKRVTGPGLTPAEWNYAYLSGPVEVTGPDNTFTRYTFGTGFQTNEGKLLQVEQGSGPNDIRRSQFYSYDLGTTRKVGTSPQPRNDSYTSEYLLPQKSSVITQDGVTFQSEVASTCNGNALCFDTFARPLTVTKSSSLGYSKTEVTTYADNLSSWVLGQVATKAINGTEINRTDYDSHALPWRTYSYGVLQNTLTYNTDGTLATAKDGNNNVTTLSNWKRGVPQSILHADNTTESAVVNDDGTIGSTTDETGAKTCYTYDVMGRLASITYPSEASAGVCDTSTWAATFQTFVPVTTAEFGIPDGHWRQQVTTGNARKFTYFDGLWRPLVTQEYDAGNVTATQHFVRHAYDASGHETFVSYPGTTDALTLGARTTYDVLDRVTRVDQDSELGAPISTVTEYLTGFQRRITNPRGKVTTQQFEVYDTPSYDAPSLIDAPQGQRAVIQRDIFGKPTAVTRSGPDI